MRHFFGIFGVVAILLLLVVAGSCDRKGNSAGSQPVTIVFIGEGPRNEQESLVDERVFSEFKRTTGINVKYIPGPESATDRLQLYLNFFQSKAETPDVYFIDIAWPAVLAPDLVDLNSYLADEAKQHLPMIVEGDTVDGKLVSMPYHVVTGVLYYRSDLLSKYGFSHPPATWDELERMASKIQAGERAAGHPNFWGYSWQGAAYEGLTCDALEWQASQGGGRVIEPDGTISVNNPHAVEALKRAKSWIGRISPPSVVEYKENDSRNLWVAGNAAFIRDWSWWATDTLVERSPVAMGHIAMAPLPSGSAGRAAVVGGYSLGISRYSAHPKEAAEFVRYLTSREVQDRYWNETGMLSARTDFFQNVGSLRSRPNLEQMQPILAHDAVLRPSTVTRGKYDLVSRAYFSAVHSVLVGDARPEKALADLEKTLHELTGLNAVAKAPAAR